MTKIRCFIAVDVKDSEVSNKITQIQQDLRSTGAQLKLVTPENLHFTLHFLGNIDVERIPELETIIDEIKGESFPLELVGLGCFRPSRPRVIWIGCTTGADELIHHQKVLGSLLRTAGFAAENRKYSPHLTIARVRSGQNRVQLMKLVQQHANLEFGVLNVNSIMLKKSTLTPKGPIYEDLVIRRLDEVTN